MINIINGRKIGIMCSGFSLSLLEDTIEDFRDISVCWVAVNCLPQADKILSKIGKHVEIAMYANQERYKEHKEYVDKTKVYVLRDGFENKNGHSLEILVHSFNEIGKEDIYIFGADGIGAYYPGVDTAVLETSNHLRKKNKYIEDNELKATNVGTKSSYKFPLISYSQAIKEMK